MELQEVSFVVDPISDIFLFFLLAVPLLLPLAGRVGLFAHSPRPDSAFASRGCGLTASIPHR
jgi:hypothetical protein